MHTLYDTLKVSEDAPQEVIKAAFKALSGKFHPDKNPGNEAAAEMMKNINAAYDTLSDQALRSRYDDLLRRARGYSNIEGAGSTQQAAQEYEPTSAATSPEPSASKTSWMSYIPSVIIAFVSAKLFGALGGICGIVVFAALKAKKVKTLWATIGGVAVSFAVALTASAMLGQYGWKPGQVAKTQAGQATATDEEWWKKGSTRVDSNDFDPSRAMPVEAPPPTVQTPVPSTPDLKPFEGKLDFDPSTAKLTEPPPSQNAPKKIDFDPSTARPTN